MSIELDSKIEQLAKEATKLSFCSGLNLLKLKGAVAQMLEVIGKNRIFDEYTLHNISHINEMLKIAEWLIPNNTKSKMTSSEWLMLTLAIYFHDLGMVVSKNEFENRSKNSLFVQYKNNMLAQDDSEESISDEYLYQEFVRENHAARIKNWLENKEPLKFGQAEEQIGILAKELDGLSKQFKIDLALICESHHKDDIENFEKYKISKRYGSDSNASVNLCYIAIVLRITDLLHISNDRTPSISKKLLNIANPKSAFEWAKQEAVTAIVPKAERDSDGNIDESIEKNTIEVHAYFAKPESAEAYFGLSDYLLYVESELNKCNKVAEIAKRQEGAHHDFPWKKIDVSNIDADGFETKKLSFVLEQENILQLLVGHTLYNDSSVVVRELAQNAIDAIKLQGFIDDKKGIAYNGKVLVGWDSKNRILSFSDNGTGMTIYEIENFLLRVGASKYRQKHIKEEFDKFSPISRFGIGILTCFMIAHDIDIETNPNNDDEVNIICLRNVHGKYLLKKKSKREASDYISEHGTIIKLHVRQNIDMSSLEHNLHRWIVNPGVEVDLIIDDDEAIRIDKPCLKDIIVDYLKDEGISVDGNTVKVEEKTINGVTIACALKYNKYMSDWSFMEIYNSTSKDNFPFGTCVEGIRVEFASPGYKSTHILAIANIKNSEYQTNVARTALEYDSDKKTLKSIYECYRKFIEDQIKALEELNYSKSWALNEGYYLMLPLMQKANYSTRIEPIDQDLLLECLSEIQCVFVENEAKRDIISVNQMKALPKFDIVDCKVISAIEWLLKETQISTTVSEIVRTVCKDVTIFESTNPIISNYSEFNMLHEFGLRDKEVSSIIVDAKNRKIKLTFENRNDIWENYEFGDTNMSTVHIPKREFNINGLNNEIGVESIGGIYLRSGTKFCAYIQKICNYFNQKQTRESKVLLQLFLENIFDSQYLENRIRDEDVKYVLKHLTMQNSGRRVNDTLVTKLWDEIDSNEFAEIILKTNIYLFSVNNWTRKASDFDF